MEDAALVCPENGPGLVFTVDFITPIVDEPEAYGAIAAANSLSDVYAMGGEPMVALAVCGYPDDKLAKEVLARIFRGGRDKAAEAGCAIVGGHTVLDPELKYGLAVIGTVDPARALLQTRARAGDRLVLTKPIGTGIAAQAIKARTLAPADIACVIALMSALNREAKNAALACFAHAATDVTGFGLLGHLHNLASASKLAARVRASAVPVLDFARDLARQGLVPGGTKRNLAWVEPNAAFAPGLSHFEKLILCDAQTSGGLLIAVPAEREVELVADLTRRGTAAAASIGELVAGEPGTLEIAK
jgi:selenide,water dikinase